MISFNKFISVLFLSCLLSIFAFGKYVNPVQSLLIPELNTKAEVREANVKMTMTTGVEDLMSYQITYKISSDRDLLTSYIFISDEIKSPARININGNSIIISNIDEADMVRFPNIKIGTFLRSNVFINDNIYTEITYFKVELKKGENYITINYETIIERESDRKYEYKHDYVTFPILYYLFPSQYWETFENLKITLILSKPLKLSTYKKPIKENEYSWYFPKVTQDKFELEIIPELSLKAKIITKISPLGFTIILGVFLVLIHIHYIKKDVKNQTKISFALIIGNLLIPVLLLFVIYPGFSNWIERQSTEEYISSGYNRDKSYLRIALIFIFPAIWLVYSLLLWGIKRYLNFKRVKRKQNGGNIESQSQN